MTSRRVAFAAIVTALTLLVGMGQGCQGPDSTSTGNPSAPPTVGMKIAAFTPVVGGNSLTDLKMCLQRLRFKGASGTSDSGNINLNVGDVDVTPAGADLSSVEVPTGTFDRIEFDLSNSCGTGSSLVVTNNSGTFATNVGITIRFDGTITISDGETVNLLIQQIVNALAPVTNATDLKNAAESVSGDCN